MDIVCQPIQPRYDVRWYDAEGVTLCILSLLIPASQDLRSPGARIGLEQGVGLPPEGRHYLALRLGQRELPGHLASVLLDVLSWLQRRGKQALDHKHVELSSL